MYTLIYGQEFCCSAKISSWRRWLLTPVKEWGCSVKTCYCMKACSNFVFDHSRHLAMTCARKYRKFRPDPKTTHRLSIPLPEQCVLRHLAQLPGNSESASSMLQFHSASVFLISDYFKSKCPIQFQLYIFFKVGQGVRSKFFSVQPSSCWELKWNSFFSLFYFSFLFCFFPS